MRAAGGRALVTISPELPPAGAWLWAAFCDLDGARPGAMGAEPIPYLELAAYAALYGFRWEVWEMQAIRALDRARLIFFAEQQSQ